MNQFIDLLIENIKELYPKANLKPTHLAENVSILSDNFVKSKQNQDYLNSLDAYFAYLLYFMPINMLKLPYMLDKIDLSGHKELNILDCGTGTGTFSFASVDYFAQHYPDTELNLTLLDSAGSHIEKTRNLFTHMIQNGSINGVKGTRFIVSDIGSMNLPDRYDVIILGNVVNELDENTYLALIQKLKKLLNDDGHIILIEPALKKLSQKALLFRDVATKSGLFPIFPCIQTIETPSLCPALSQDEWCHQSHTIDKDKWISGIDKYTGFIKDDIRYTGIVFSLKAVVDNPNAWRVVSELMDEKGLSKAYLCHDDIRILTRRLSKNKSEHNQKWKKIRKGDRLEITNEQNNNGVMNITGETIINDS